MQEGQLPVPQSRLWRHGARAMLEVDHGQVQPLRGLRLALGVAIPLAVGIATGQERLGAFACGGALGVGFGAFLGVSRTHALTLMAAAAAIGLSLFVGSLSGHSALLTVALVALWGFAAGLQGVFGPAAYFVGVQAALHLLLGSGFPADLQEATARAAAAFAGGSLQTLLTLGVWPWRRFDTVRSTLADGYRSLARYARSGGDDRSLPPSLATTEIYRVFADQHPFGNHRDVALFQRLLDEAEQIRVALAPIARPFARPGKTATDATTAAMREAVASILDEIARAVYTGRAPEDEGQAWRLLQQDDAVRPQPITASRSRDARTVHVRRLVAQLRTAWRIAGDAPQERRDAPLQPARKRHSPGLGASAQTLRAALTTRSSSFRHALRIAITVAIAAALSRLIGQPNAYWLPITVLLVLQPAFGDTITRGLSMMAGTVAGAILATLVASLLRPEGWELAALIVLFAWLSFTMFRASYALFAACITAYVVFLVSFFGLPEPAAALSRVLAIVTGGSVALAAYALWPTWEAEQVPERLAEALNAQARYAKVLLTQIGMPEARDDAALRRARLDAQRARSNAENSVERMLVEPPATNGLAASKALGVAAAIRTFAFAGLALEAARVDSARAPWTSLRLLANGIEQSLCRIAAALRSGSPPAALPPLRALHARLRDGHVPQRATMPVGDEECLTLEGLVLSETDLMVDSVETIAQLAGKASRQPTPEG